SMLPPLRETTKASTMRISGLTHAASAPALLRFAFRVATHAQGWLPAGWLAFTGRASNPLDHYERFQITWSSPIPVLLTLLTFHTRAWLSFAPSTCRMPLGPSQASPELIPEEGSPPGFDIAYPETRSLPRTQAAGLKLTSYPRSLMRLASLVTMRALSRLTRKSAPRSWWNVPFLSMW